MNCEIKGHINQYGNRDTFEAARKMIVLTGEVRLDNSVLNGRYELCKKQGEFGSVKSAVVAHVWLNDNSMKIRLIASGIFAVSLDRGGNKLTMGVKQC